MMTDVEIPTSIYDITVKDLHSNDVKLDKYRGKCMLIVNIASECKLMKENFARLRALKKKFSNDLAILFFPSNQFMGMPQKDSSEIIGFLDRENVDFAETFAMVCVNGTEADGLFKYLKRERPGIISWNYHKFLVSKSGQKVERFSHRNLFLYMENEIKQCM
ncbi:CLUMA_CG002516, isoform A [Clunio marinus]|uniref:Glutathione peroxidase n=1 Tax=Clunio marinus TaxID=568069 RepID=A0A1J1HRX2_9DIPT|nr:CLUMA_CG002516, isoform A [Clunio marinus]